MSEAVKEVEISNDKCKRCKKKNELGVFPISCKLCNPKIYPKPPTKEEILQKKLNRFDGINYRCPSCKLWKSPDYFRKNNKVGAQCKLCYRAYKKERYKRPEVKQKEYIHLMRRHFKKAYGITLEQYQEMLIKQQGKCDICGKEQEYNDFRSGKKTNLAVDHCHETGKVRALLCVKCNQGLGCFKEDPSLFDKAKDYIEKHKRHR